MAVHVSVLNHTDIEGLLAYSGVGCTVGLVSNYEQQTMVRICKYQKENEKLPKQLILEIVRTI
jgi:hypothetical protein